MPIMTVELVRQIVREEIEKIQREKAEAEAQRAAVMAPIHQKAREAGKAAASKLLYEDGVRDSGQITWARLDAEIAVYRAHHDVPEAGDIVSRVEQRQRVSNRRFI